MTIADPWLLFQYLIWCQDVQVMSATVHDIAVGFEYKWQPPGTLLIKPNKESLAKGWYEHYNDKRTNKAG